MATAAPRNEREYRLATGEPVPSGIARIARGRFDSALDELKGEAGNGSVKGVHEARKDMKKLRSLLRLVRREVGEETYRRESEYVRDAGRRLSGVRDADVMIETLDELAAGDPAGLPAELVAQLHKALEAHRRTVSEDGDGRERAQREAVAELAAARSRVDEWPLERNGFAALAKGLERTYRRGRRAYKVARKDPSAANMHEWRKRVKDLWYQHKLIECAWPEPLKAYSAEAHRLSDLLGSDHDLAVLRDWALANPAGAGSLPQLEELSGALDRRRAQLQAEALVLGGRIYSEKPGAHIRRLRTYWDSWRAAPAAPAAGLHTAG